MLTQTHCRLFYKEYVLSLKPANKKEFILCIWMPEAHRNKILNSYIFPYNMTLKEKFQLISENCIKLMEIFYGKAFFLLKSDTFWHMGEYKQHILIITCKKWPLSRLIKLQAYSFIL